MMEISGIFLLLFFLFEQNLPAAVFESSSKQTRVLELYSSEGCSSCPPAEKWVGQLKNAKGLWRDFIPVAFHVTYWDYIGWKDKLASELFTRRQRTYVSYWNQHIFQYGKQFGLYTPCIVLDGKAWENWYRQRSVSASNKNAGILKVSGEFAKPFNVAYQSGEGVKKGYSIEGVLLGFGIVSKVTRGENRGRTLEHDFVVLDYRTAKMNENAEGYDVQMAFQSPEGIEPGRYGVAFWVHTVENPEPLQAAGGYL